MEHPIGAGFAHCEGNFKTVQYFGSFGDPGALATFPTLTARRSQQWDVGDDGVRLWRVVSTGLEVQDHVGAPVDPLSVPEIEAQGTPRSSLKLRVSASQMGFDPRDFLIDVGQSLDLYGQRIHVDYLSAPEVVRADQQIGPAAGPFILNGLLSVHILAIENPLSPTALFTTYHRVANNAVVSIPIPRGAIRATVYQSPAGNASTAWRWSIGPATLAASWILGELPFIAGQRATLDSVVPGATHLLSDAGNVSERFYTVVWTIKP